jgi:hypothetical protein
MDYNYIKWYFYGTIMPNTYLNYYPESIQQKMHQGFLSKLPELGAGDPAGVISRIFNNMNFELDEEFYKQFIENFLFDDYGSAYQKLHQLVKVTLDEILKQKDNIELASELKGLFDDESKLNSFISALITLYTMELSNAFAKLPDDIKNKQLHNFSGFLKSADTLSSKLKLSNIKLELTDIYKSANAERISVSNELIQSEFKNIEAQIQSLGNTLSNTITNLTSYIKSNHNNPKLSELKTILENLEKCQYEINNSAEPYTTIYQKVSKAQHELKEIKSILRGDRKAGFMSQISHQVTKYLTPLKTISGINAELERVLKSFDPKFVDQNTHKTDSTKEFKERKSTMVTVVESESVESESVESESVESESVESESVKSGVSITSTHSKR